MKTLTFYTIAWRSSYSMWYGARRFNGVWRWAGKTTEPVTAILWDDSQPDFGANDNCMGSWFGGSNRHTGKSHDAVCSHPTHYICELVL